jgi:hypothetical protein
MVASGHPVGWVAPRFARSGRYIARVRPTRRSRARATDPRSAYGGEDAPIPDPYLHQPRPEPPPPLPPAPLPPTTSSHPPAGVSDGRPTSAYATWALVLGLLALLCFGPGPILGTIAIALGVLAHREIGRSGGRVGGRALATAGVTMGILSFAVFGGLVAAYMHYAHRWSATTAPIASTAPPSPAANTTPPSASEDGGAASSDDATAGPPLPTISTITTIGTITVVDVAGGVPSLSKELRNQRTAAAAHGEKLLLETVRATCEPCDGVADALGDPKMQKALDHVRLVRVDRDQFQEDLEELSIPADRIPGFFLLDSDLHVTDGIAGDEWDDDVATNIAPVLGPFMRGTYTKRRNPWKAPRPSGTVM